MVQTVSRATSFVWRLFVCGGWPCGQVCFGGGGGFESGMLVPLLCHTANPLQALAGFGAHWIACLPSGIQISARHWGQRSDGAAT